MKKYWILCALALTLLLTACGGEQAAADTAEEAVRNAKAAQAKLADMTLEKRGELIAAMRKAGIDNAEYLARLAHEETGYGHVEDKIQNKLYICQEPEIVGATGAALYALTKMNG